MSALKKQVGGNHYNKLKVQPIEFIQETGLGYCTGNVVKYLTRNKQNRKEDLEKAYHYIELNNEVYRQKFMDRFVQEYTVDHEFFTQFKNGKVYAKILYHMRLGNKPKAKELLRKFINKGEYSEV